MTTKQRDEALRGFHDSIIGACRLAHSTGLPKHIVFRLIVSVAEALGDEAETEAKAEAALKVVP